MFYKGEILCVKVRIQWTQPPETISISLELFQTLKWKPLTSLKGEYIVTQSAIPSVGLEFHARYLRLIEVLRFVCYKLQSVHSDSFSDLL